MGFQALVRSRQVLQAKCLFEKRLFFNVVYIIICAGQAFILAEASQWPF